MQQQQFKNIKNTSFFFPLSATCCFIGELGPMWWQLQSVVPPGLCRTVCWASRERGLYLHKLHTARLWQSRMKTKIWHWRISSFLQATALKCTSELPCGFSPLPSGLSLVNMVLSLFFQTYKKLQSLFLSHGCFFSSAHQLILSETFQDLLQMVTYFKNQ